MLYNGERSATARRRGRHRGRPARGHDADREGHAQRAGRHRAVRARHDVRPGPCVYMDKIAAAGGRRRARPRPPAGRDLRLVAERKGIDVEDVMVVVPRPAPPRRRHQSDPRAGARMRLITDGDVAAALLAVSDARPWISVGDRRHAGGRHLRRRAEVHRRRAEGSSGRATTRSARRRSTAGYDLDRVLTSDDLVTGENCFFSATGVTDGDVLDGVRYRGPGGRDDGVARDALALRHRATDLCDPRSREDGRAHGRAAGGVTQ